MKVLAEAIVEALDRLVAQTLDLRRRHRLHDDVADRDERGVAARRFRESMVIARDREDVVVPLVDRFQIADDMRQMKQLAYLEHALVLERRARPMRGALSMRIFNRSCSRVLGHRQLLAAADILRLP